MTSVVPTVRHLLILVVLRLRLAVGELDGSDLLLQKPQPVAMSLRQQL